jgi:hypothetical protein
MVQGSHGVVVWPIARRRKVRYFLSFIEEGIMNPLYYVFRAGRIEVSIDQEQYPIEEIRFFTRDPSFEHFRETFDFQEVGAGTLSRLKRLVKNRYSKM